MRAAEWLRKAVSLPQTAEAVLNREAKALRVAWAVLLARRARVLAAA